MNTTEREVLFEIKHGIASNIGIIILNRPKALNALNHEMIMSIYNILLEWREDPEITMVVIRGNSERAFCAGGDIRSLYTNGKSKPLECMQFFRDEYQLNSLIYNYPKPYIALLHGLTMGGGIGVSLYGSHRVAAKDLMFAMPETGIGFFPDVGGSYFLPRCKNHTGIYLGLTGEKINCFEAEYLDLITHIVDNENYTKVFDSIIDKLGETEFQTSTLNTQISNLLSKYCVKIKDKDINIENNKIKSNLDLISSCFGQDSISHILNALKNNLPSNFAAETLETLQKKSPSSLLVTLKLLQRGIKLDFESCMRMEYSLAYGFLKHHDLYEGIRAAIIEKDNNPKWEKVSLTEPDSINYSEYFALDIQSW